MQYRNLMQLLVIIALLSTNIDYVNLFYFFLYDRSLLCNEIDINYNIHPIKLSIDYYYY